MPSPYREQICTHCGSSFVARGSRPFCSRACSKYVPINIRFWAKVHKTEGCWEWTGSRSKDGYGRIRVDEKLLQASRVSWFLHHGEWPDPLIKVCHHCDNPPCVHPEHLFLGTHQDNFMDAARKGRLKGVHLSDEKVAEIRALSGKTSQDQIARIYGISQTHVSRIIRRRVWT